MLGETLEYLYDQLYSSKPLYQQSEMCYIRRADANLCLFTDTSIIIM